MFTLSFLLLHLVTTTSDPKDIYMNCPDVTLRCIKSHLRHVVSLITCNIFIFLYFRFHRCTAYTVCLHVRLLRVTLYINQSINQSINSEHFRAVIQYVNVRWYFPQLQDIPRNASCIIIHHQLRFPGEFLGSLQLSFSTSSETETLEISDTCVTDRMPFLSPNQRCQIIEGKSLRSSPKLYLITFYSCPPFPKVSRKFAHNFLSDTADTRNNPTNRS